MDRYNLLHRHRPLRAPRRAHIPNSAEDRFYSVYTRPTRGVDMPPEGRKTRIYMRRWHP
jgi:hypothetical protein